MLRFGPIMLLALALAGCGDQPEVGPGPQRSGRYIGVGIYAAGELWQHLAGAARSENPRAATLRDDDHVIVILDSHTGEIRQCGNLSGHCIRMNPWSRPALPANLTTHAEDLERQADPAEPGGRSAAATNAAR